MATAAPAIESSVSYRQGVALVLLAGACWSIMGLVVRLMEAATAWQILFYRSISLGVFLLLVLTVRSRGRPIEVFRRAGLPSVLGALALVLAFCGSIFSILNTTVANAMFLFATAPFMAAGLGMLILKESVRRATWIAMAVGGLGVALMVAEGIALGHFLGNAAAVGSALGFALFAVALRRQYKEDMLPAVCLGGFFTAAVAGIMCLAGGEGLAVSTHDVLLALVLGIGQLGLGMTLFTIGSKAVPAAELALLAMSEVVLGPLWVWLALGETAGLWTLVGGAVLMAAIAGNALSGLRRKPPPIGAV
jgi:drug/metabolite transporter (DMT)-like permease